MPNDERRRWSRHRVDAVANISSGPNRHSRHLDDLSGGGASLRGKAPSDDDERLDLVLKEFGTFSGAVVRDWDDGFAVEFELNDDEQYALQEDVEAFMRENDLADL